MLCYLPEVGTGGRVRQHRAAMTVEEDDVSSSSGSPTPPQLLMMGGGAAAFVFSFMDWTKDDFMADSGNNAWHSGFLSTPTLIPLLGLLISVIVAVRVFTAVEFPERIAGFSVNQVTLALAGFCAVQGVLLLMWDVPGVSQQAGFYLSLLGSLAMAVGAVLENRADDASAPLAPPQAF
jgi:hypothetical protein